MKHVAQCQECAWSVEMLEAEAHAGQKGSKVYYKARYHSDQMHHEVAVWRETVDANAC